MIPLPSPTPLGLPAPASILEAIYLVSCSLFHILFELSLGIALLLVIQRLVKRYPLPAGVKHSLRNILPTSTLFAIAAAIAPLIVWYTLFGSVMYVGIQTLGATWLAALYRVLGALALAGLLVAAVGFHKGKDESTIRYGYRLFICSALAKLVAHALIIASPLSILLSGFAVGSAILGLTRPRNAAWLLSSTALTVLSILASTAARFHAFKQHLAPLFYVEDLSVRWQTAPMVIFFIFTAAALVVVGMMARWISIPSRYKPGGRAMYSQDHSPRVRLL